MNVTTCEHCQRTTVPLRDSFLVDGKIFCASCFNQEFADQAYLEGKTITRQIDPTVCVKCESDFGNQGLPMVAGYPVCTDCTRQMNKRIFPVWVKLFLAGLAAIIVFSFFWNWNYYQAYRDLNAAQAAMDKGNIVTAARLMRAAQAEANEVKELKFMSAYFTGIQLLQEDKSDSALSTFEECRYYPPVDYATNPFVIQARIGSSFDHKDYDEFLKASEDRLALDSSDALSNASVSSAFACQYAVKGVDSLKRFAVEFLNKAKAIDDTSADMKAYYNLIEFRLASRQILTRDQFVQQFPNGWTKPQ